MRRWVAGRALPASRRLGGALDTYALVSGPSILPIARDGVMILSVAAMSLIDSE